MSGTDGTNSFTGNIINEIFNSFNNKGIPYCVLRNYERYPEEMGGDMDILVLPEFAEKIDAAVQKIADDVGGRVWDYCGEKDASRMPRAIFRIEKGEKIEVVRLDFLFKIEQFGFEYIDVSFAIENRRSFKNFFVPDKETEFLHILIHGMFQWEALYQDRYAKKLREFLEEGGGIPKEQIRRLLTSFPASSIIKGLEEKRTDRIFTHRQINKFLFFAKNGLLFKRVIPYFLRKLKKILKTFRFSGNFVVILGPDGVGKSTTAVLVNELLNAFGLTSSHLHLGFRPVFLPQRQKFGLGEPKIKNKASVRDVLRYCYHFLDYWLAYYFRIRPRLVKKETIIAERYFYDYILHPSRKGPNVNKKLAWWTFRLFMPKPTACVLLTNDPEEILKRRQELTKEEIVDVLRRGEDLGKTARRFTKIKTDKPPEEVAIELVEWLLCKNS